MNCKARREVLTSTLSMLELLMMECVQVRLMLDATAELMP